MAFRDTVQLCVVMEFSRAFTKIIDGSRIHGCAFHTGTENWKFENKSIITLAHIAKSNIAMFLQLLNLDSVSGMRKT